MIEFAWRLRRDCPRISDPKLTTKRRARRKMRPRIERLRLQSCDLGFQVPHALLQVRQAIERCREFHPQTAVHGRGSSNDRARGQIASQPRLSVDYASVADGEMARAGGLAGENTVVTDSSGAGEADLAAEHGVGANARGVTYEHEVIKLGAAGNAGLPDGRAVDAGVGLNFNIVFEDRRAGLLHFVPGTVFLLGEAKTIT